MVVAADRKSAPDSKLRQLIEGYVQTAHMMQLASASGGQPWCCTVYFVPDEDLNLYWISVPGRRHSREIARHGKVAAAIPIRYTPGQPVVGVQVEGDAERVGDSETLKLGARLYDERFRHDDNFYEDFVNDRRQHKFYRLRPRLFVLFDEVTFPENTRREWRPSTSPAAAG